MPKYGWRECEESNPPIPLVIKAIDEFSGVLPQLSS